MRPVGNDAKTVRVRPIDPASKPVLKPAKAGEDGAARPWPALMESAWIKRVQGKSS